jgi:hypothetical protein
MKMYGWLKWFVVLALATTAPMGSAAIVPITSVTCDHPTGTPPYNLLSITVGNYTVTADRLGVGTSSIVPAGTPLPRLDNLDLSEGYSSTAGTIYKTVGFGGSPTWKDSNGDNPDFFIFESGGEDAPAIAAILPGGVVGQAVTVTGKWGQTKYNRPAVSVDAEAMQGQPIVGFAFAITDLLDASGKPLTNSSEIEGIQTTRNGMDPMTYCAVVPLAILAKNPSPADKATEVLRDAILSWKPAEGVKTQDVYFGTASSSVTNASRTSSMGVLVSQVQDANTYDPPGLLALGTTYYWRIDEVEAATSTVYKGNVWSFATEALAYPVKNVTATASSSQNADMGPEKTVDGSGLVNDLHSTTAEHMWLSSPTGPTPTWIQYQFDKVYKLQEMWVWNSNQVVEGVLGVGAKDVTIEYSADGSTWAVLSDAQFARASGAAGYAHNTTVDLKGIAAKYVKLTIKSNWGGLLSQFSLSEVRFFYVPVSAREPNPAPGATGVSPQVTLSWRAGREAASHSVYVSTDKQAVVNGTAPAAKVSEPRYEASVDLGQSYFWKVVEVNDTQTPKSWEGDVWSFATANWIVVEDFESYNDDLKAKTTIFDTWIDGYAEGFKSNGSTVGKDAALNGTFGETQIVHGGKQSMPLSYNNAGGIATSEATRTFASAQDWTKHGITTLVLYFYGDPANAAGQVYVKLDGTKVVYSANANALKTPYWTQWNIDLASAGANLKSVAKLAIGVEGNGKGILYVDDIRLYRTAPQPPKELLWIEAESGTITKPMAVSDDPTASGGKYISTQNLGVTAIHTDGMASYPFTVKGGTYKIYGRVVDVPAGRNSFWVRIKGATLDTVPDADGWCNWNFPTGVGWHWDDVSNGTNSLTDPAVRFTLKAGSYTLEIAYREDGARLDAIVITDETN